MKNNQNEEPITIFYSIYDFYPTKFFYGTDGYAKRRGPMEYIYEVEIRDMNDFTKLWIKQDKKVKYKKPNDKNWYTYRAMLNRLFKKELNQKADEPVLCLMNPLY